MTYTQATKDTYTPPACSECGGPTDVEWITFTPGGMPFPPDHPDVKLVPGRATCSARCWEVGHVAPPCPRCGADGAINWPEVTKLGAQTQHMRGSNYCTAWCSEKLTTLLRGELHKLYPGWEW